MWFNFWSILLNTCARFAKYFIRIIISVIRVHVVFNRCQKGNTSCHEDSKTPQILFGGWRDVLMIFPVKFFNIQPFHRKITEKWKYKIKSLYESVFDNFWLNLLKKVSTISNPQKNINLNFF